MLDGEEAIIRDAVSGEASAFGLLYDHYQPHIYRFVVIRVGRREEAEDLTHQVFLRALQNIAKYEHRGLPFSSWLYQIARNQLIDYYRTRRNAASLDEVDAQELASGERTETAAEKRMEFERVMKGVRKLKSEYQDVVILRFVEELSPKEVAHILEKSEGAVKLMQHRAIRELKKILEA